MSLIVLILYSIGCIVTRLIKKQSKTEVPAWTA